MSRLEDIPPPDEFIEGPLYDPGEASVTQAAPRDGTGVPAPSTPASAPQVQAAEAAAQAAPGSPSSPAASSRALRLTFPTVSAHTPSAPTPRAPTPRASAPPASAPASAAQSPSDDPATSVVEAVNRLERAFANTQGAILDILKSTPTVTQTRPTRHRIWFALWAALAGAALSGGTTYAAMTFLVAPAAPADQRLQAWADSWSYLWRVSPTFRECWTSFLNTRRPQACTLSLGDVSTSAGGKK